MAQNGNRIALIDGLRGYFLVLMMASHLHFQGGAMLLRVHHGEGGFVEDAQGFVFLSGLVVGLTYARILARKGAPALTAKALSRVGELYRMLLLTLAVVMGLALAIPHGAEIWGWQLGKLAEDPLGHIGVAAALLYQPAYLDILPQYMLYLVAAPFIVRWTAAGHGLTVMAASAALWTIAQMGLHLPAIDALGRLVAAADDNGSLRSYFNPLGWQLLFVGGTVIGTAAASGRLKAETLLGRHRLPLVLIALAMVFVFAAVRIVHGLGLLDGELGARFYRGLRREDLSLVYVANFAALAYVFAWMLYNAASEGLPRPLAFIGWTLTRMFTVPFLVFLGQHSLQVYAFHAIVAYGVVALDWYGGPFGELTKSAIIGLSVLSLLIPAVWHSLNQRREAARTRPTLSTPT
ncbi:OpgC family protein [Zavarzinia compransoris]|uniref:OpgC domain-containing protein n=1 Tax=Zavarzinia compransoris TaxID=1264899 RepID=A0A317DY73_9PROT|nr:OpgC domain-containing protein [Zavarzinia compransoris]PWR19678.1 hypothetical protein DKG75_14510 [Zavarzinia compransoris]TDP43378.1 hypothetical protein DES42_11279 [Zavarzinia compransoris]